MAIPNIDIKVAVKQVVLKKHQLSFTSSIPMHVIENMDIYSQLHYMADSMLVNMRSYLSAHEWQEIVSKAAYEEVPLTWIDHLRHEYFPNFMSKKYPIKYRTIKTSGDISNNYWIFPSVPPNPNKDIQSFIMSYTDYQTRNY